MTTFSRTIECLECGTIVARIRCEEPQDVEYQDGCYSCSKYKEVDKSDKLKT